MSAPTLAPPASSWLDRDRLVRAAPALVLVLVAVLIPLMFGPRDVDRITAWIPLAIAALGLNLLTGYNGQISVGHGALYGLGAYAAGMLVTEWRWPMLLAALGGAVVAFVAGVIIGLPALRIRGLYLALVTLAVAMLFPDLIRQFDDVTGGSSGYKITSEQLYRGSVRERAIRWEAPSWSGLADDQWRYYVFLVVAVVCFVLVRNLVNSRTGRALVAIRDNEVAAEVNGVNVARVKVLSFGVSAALAGIGGALYALWATQLFPQSFLITASFYFLVAVVVGGPATILGPAIGALFYGFFYDIVRPELPERAESATPLILGILLIVLMRVAPGGVVGSARHLMARFAVTRGAAGGPEAAEGWSTNEASLTDELGEGGFEAVSGEISGTQASDNTASEPDGTELEDEE